MRRTVAWQHEPGAETAEVTADETGVHAAGTLIRVWPSGPFRVDYEIRCDAKWCTTDALVTISGNPPRHLQLDHSALLGCADVDLAACAFTNTLPIRRLHLAVGESQTISVAFISIPELRAKAVQQRYTRLETRRYRYEGLDTGFTAEITVDEDGLVIDYPQLCRRVWPQS